jgi:hypothetical protein
VSDDDDLAALQVEMLRALHEGESVDDVLTRLRSASLSDTHRVWIDSFDRRAIEVALAIAKRWIRVEGD